MSLTHRLAVAPQRQSSHDPALLPFDFSRAKSWPPASVQDLVAIDLCQGRIEIHSDHQLAVAETPNYLRVVYLW